MKKLTAFLFVLRKFFEIKNFKRIFAGICAIVLVLSGCRSVGKTPDLKTVLPEVGRTFSDLRQQYPTYEYLHLGGCDCSLECLGEPGGKSALVFFGTQAGPGLDEVAPSRQTELKCAGIYTSLGQVFTLSEDKTVEDLLKSLNINLAEVTDWNGWLLTDYQGYRMIINTEYENADKTEIISALADPNWVLVITDETVIANNEKRLCACEDTENNYYCERENGAYLLYRQEKATGTKTVLCRESYLDHLLLADTWLYYEAADQNICRVATDGSEHAVLFNYQQAETYEQEPLNDLFWVDGYLLIRLNFGLYRYDIPSETLDELYYDARHVAISGQDVYVSGRECTIYRIDVARKSTEPILESDMTGNDKEKWKNLYKNFIFIGETMYYFQRSPDGLYSYQNGESLLIDGDKNIDEALIEYQNKLYYISVNPTDAKGDRSATVMCYDPATGTVTEAADCENYVSGIRICDGLFYYHDVAEDIQTVRLKER